MDLLFWFNLLLSIFTFGSFIWVALFYFGNKDKTSQREFQLIKNLGALFILAHWLAAVYPKSFAYSFIGTILLIASSLLLWQSIYLHRKQPLDFAFSSVEPKKLTKRGAYSLVRHPIYLSYLLGWVGGALASGWLLLLVSAIVMGGIYIKAIEQEEEAFLKSDFSSEYFLYSKKVKRLIPFIY